MRLLSVLVVGLALMSNSAGAEPAAPMPLNTAFDRALALAASFPVLISALTDPETGPTGLSGTVEDEVGMFELLQSPADSVRGHILLRNDPETVVGFSCLRFGPKTRAALQERLAEQGGDMFQYLADQMSGTPDTAALFQTCTVVLPILPDDTAGDLSALIAGHFNLQPFPHKDWIRGEGPYALADGIITAVEGKITEDHGQAILNMHIQSYVPQPGA